MGCQEPVTTICCLGGALKVAGFCPPASRHADRKVTHKEPGVDLHTQSLRINALRNEVRRYQAQTTSGTRRAEAVGRRWRAATRSSGENGCNRTSVRAPSDPA